MGRYGSVRVGTSRYGTTGYNYRSVLRVDTMGRYGLVWGWYGSVWAGMGRYRSVMGC